MQILRFAIVYDEKIDKLFTKIPGFSPTVGSGNIFSKF